MTNTYNWIIEKIDCIPSLNGQTDVVCNVHWRVNGVSSETYSVSNTTGGSTSYPYTVTVCGNQLLSYEAGQSFTPFSQLTETIVLGWVQNAIGTNGITEIQNKIDALLNNLINPTVITPNLPWGNS